MQSQDSLNSIAKLKKAGDPGICMKSDFHGFPLGVQPY
jgi:hypothetical protein